MTTGDLKNNMRKLTSELKQVKYDLDKLDIDGLSKGVSSAFLPIYHYIFIDFNKSLAESIAKYSLGMQGKTDLRFIELMYKLLRDMFTYKPPITKEQFFATGFVERKVIMCTAIISLVKPKKTQSVKRKDKIATSQKAGPKVSQMQNIEVKNPIPKGTVAVSKAKTKTIDTHPKRLAVKENTVPVMQSKTRQRPSTAPASQSQSQKQIPAVPELFKGDPQPSTIVRNPRTQVRTVERHVHAIPMKRSQSDLQQKQVYNQMRKMKEIEEAMKTLAAQAEELRIQQSVVREATNRVVTKSSVPIAWGEPLQEPRVKEDNESPKTGLLNQQENDFHPMFCGNKIPIQVTSRNNEDDLLVAGAISENSDVDRMSFSPQQEEVILIACPENGKTFNVAPSARSQSTDIFKNIESSDAITWNRPPIETNPTDSLGFNTFSVPTLSIHATEEYGSDKDLMETDTAVENGKKEGSAEHEQTVSTPQKSKPASLFSPITPVHGLQPRKTNLQDDDELLFSSQKSTCIQTSKVSTPTDPSKDVSNIIELEFVNSPLKAKANRIADMMMKTQNMLKMKVESQSRPDEVE